MNYLFWDIFNFFFYSVSRNYNLFTEFECNTCNEKTDPDDLWGQRVRGRNIVYFSLEKKRKQKNRAMTSYAHTRKTRSSTDHYERVKTSPMTYVYTLLLLISTFFFREKSLKNRSITRTYKCVVWTSVVHQIIINKCTWSHNLPIEYCCCCVDGLLMIINLVSYSFSIFNF